MKKTGTTIFTLALALILVSTLSSGVILADDDDEKKDRRRGREVVIFDCAQIATVPIIFVSAVDSSMGAPMIDPSEFPFEGDPIIVSCAQTFADMLYLKFKVEDITTTYDFLGMRVVTRYIMIKK